MQLRSPLAGLLAGLVAACGEPSLPAGRDAAAVGSADASDAMEDVRGIPPEAADGQPPAEGGPPEATDGAPPASPDADAPPPIDAGWPLGMNDVTILTPLPEGAAVPVLLRGGDPGRDGTALLPRDLFSQLVARTCLPFTSGAVPRNGRCAR